MDALSKKTTKAEQKLAGKSAKQLRSIEGSNAGAIDIQVQGSGEIITIPQKALVLLSEILQTMADGKSVSIISLDSELSSQEAADLLNVSRPHLVKLLDSGEIPFKKVGTHRRVLFKDLIAYQEKLARIREEQLEFLTKQAQDLNLGY